MRLAGATLGLILAGAALAPAQSGSPVGIEIADLNRSVEPCTDFYEFANGRWRAENPIPASMPRWSRRWAAGESAKDRLRDILGEASAVPNPPKGSVDQLIGDFYGACIDEAQANALGAGPVAPLLAEIDAIRNVAGVQAMIGRLHALGVAVPFKFTAGSDRHNPTDVVAQIDAGGLGMPDRAYYIKPDARFTEARTKYLTHVASLFRAGGRGRRGRRSGRTDRHAYGDAARRRLARQRGAPGPRRHGSQDAVQRAAAARAGVQLDDLLPAGRRHAGAGQRQRAAIPGDAESRAHRGPGRRVEGLSEMAPARHRGAVALRGVRPGGLRLPRGLPERGRRDEAALEALRGADRRPARRSPRTEIRRALFPGRGQEPGPGDGAEPAARGG